MAFRPVFSRPLRHGLGYHPFPFALAGEADPPPSRREILNGTGSDHRQLRMDPLVIFGGAPGVEGRPAPPPGCPRSRSPPKLDITCFRGGIPPRPFKLH